MNCCVGGGIQNLEFVIRSFGKKSHYSDDIGN